MTKYTFVNKISNVWTYWFLIFFAKSFNLTIKTKTLSKVWRVLTKYYNITVMFPCGNVWSIMNLLLMWSIIIMINSDHFIIHLVGSNILRSTGLWSFDEKSNQTFEFTEFKLYSIMLLSFRWSEDLLHIFISGSSTNPTGILGIGKSRKCKTKWKKQCNMKRYSQGWTITTIAMNYPDIRYNPCLSSATTVVSLTIDELN